MLKSLALRRDIFAGALMGLIGAGAIAEGMRYKIGTLNRMGPGFVPVAVGVVLVVLGVIIAVSPQDDGEDAEPVGKDLRGGLCIVAGVLAFMGLGAFAGLLPAIFGCVFISALGDRDATLRSSVLLAAGVAVCGSIIFATFLKIPFPLIRWN